MKCCEFLDKLQTSYLLNKHSSPCSMYVSYTSKVIICDNGSRFRSPSWERKLSALELEISFSAVRHTQSNTSERIIKELSKFCVYCHQNHSRWADLLPQIEQWLNVTVDSSTCMVQWNSLRMHKKPDILAKFLPEIRYSPINEKLSSKVSKS